MEKADEISDKRTVAGKHRTYENKQQTTSETSNLDSGSSSYNTCSENADGKVNIKASRKKKLQNGLIENHSSGDADNDTRIQNVEELAGHLDREVEKSSLSSDEYEDSKVSVGNQKETLSRHLKKEVESKTKDLEDETGGRNKSSSQGHHANDSDESDAMEHDVKVCDICGDAGREDLLAVCCRCVDGAEHTYCMRVMIDKVPEGDWLCEECELDEENKKANRKKNGGDTGAAKDQFFDTAAVKVSAKRRAEELESSSSFKKQALETTSGSTKDVDRGKVKPSRQFSSDSLFGNDSTEAACSPATRPRLQSLQGGLSKSNSFSFPNSKPKSKLVDETVLQRQKSIKELPSHEAREMGKSMSFRSTNLGRLGASGSKVKMLSPKSSHLQDLKSLKAKKERSFERTNSSKLSTSSSATLTPNLDKSLVSRGETTSVSSSSNSEVKPLKVDGKSSLGLKSTSRPANISAEAPVSLAPVSKQLPSSPTKVVTASSSGILSSSEQKSIPLKEDNSSRVSISKEPTNVTYGIKETSTGSHLGSGVTPAQESFGNNASLAMGSSKEMKNQDNKLKDAIEAALLKKPGIYRKNRVSDESSVSIMNNEVPVVDRVPHSRNTVGNLASAEVATDWHGQVSKSSNVDHSKQANGNNSKKSMILPAEGKHLTTENQNSIYEAVPLPSLSKIQAFPDHECIWQGSFEINRSGKTAEFWDGLQAHLSTCASPRVSEAVNKLPHKILLNGVSRVSAWPSQFEIGGVKEDNVAIYFFAKDIETYEKSYQLLLDDMIRGDLALIGSINGVELLIFPSNQLPEKSNRWNMLFFLWGVFRGKKKNSLHQIPNNPEKTCVPQDTSSTSTDKMLPGDSALHESINKDKQVDSESKGNSKLQTFSQTKAIDGMSIQLDAVNVVQPVTDGNASAPNNSYSQDLVKFSRNQETEPRKRAFIDLSDDDDFTPTNQINTWRDARSQVPEEGNVKKKQKNDSYGQNSYSPDEKTVTENSNNGERYFFPLMGSSFSENHQQQQTAPQKMKLALDLNEDISCLAGATDDVIMTESHKEDDDADVASSLSLSLAFSPPVDKDEEDGGKGKCISAPSMLLFRNVVDK